MGNLCFLHVFKYLIRAKYTRIPYKTRGELRCSGRICSSCFNSSTCYVSISPKSFTLYVPGNILTLCLFDFYRIWYKSLFLELKIKE